ncbi:hypothetical protein KAR91_05345 [Candidatus Pacearchaeota archaeon]|nr:hypothetical protein [Candidatus Pacearchaeota archaeon]
MNKMLTEKTENQNDAGKVLENQLCDFSVNGAQHLGDGIFSASVIIIPELAEELMERNTENRPMKGPKVKKYAKEIRSGNWCLNGEPIIFGIDGLLLSGQNRLKACLEADEEFKTIVTWGVPKGSYETIDRPAPRSIADDIAIKDKGLDLPGGGDHYNKASICRAICGDINGIRGRHQTANPSEKSIKEVRNVFPEVYESLSIVQQCTKARILKGSMAGFLYVKFSILSKPHAVAFFKKLSTGSDLREGDPILLIREKLLKAKFKKETIPHWSLSFMLHKVWNYWVMERTMTNSNLISSFGGKNVISPKV